jgi:hypothetical protein
MAEKETPFVVNDRRKFRADGELRDPESLAQTHTEEAPAAPAPQPEKTPEPTPQATEQHNEEPSEDQRPPPPTPEEIADVRKAFDQTADRLDTVMRASNPGGDHLPPMNFDRLVQSVYMTAMMQLGYGTPQGEKARVDLMGARQSIDMLKVLEEKSVNNRSDDETKLIESALFELRMMFLQMTQALARSAASQQGAGGVPGVSGVGPKLVP